MSAETLRRAAALMRERAEAAIPGPWVAAVSREDTDGTDPNVPEHYWDTAIDRAENDTDESWTVAYWQDVYDTTANAEHIASWDPAVALAVADLLDRAAADHDETPCPAIDAALTAARAYLGETS